MDVIETIKGWILTVYDIVPDSVKTMVGNALSAGLYALVFVFLESLLNSMEVSVALTFAFRAALKAFLGKLPIPDQSTEAPAKGRNKPKSVAQKRLQAHELVV